MKADGWTRIALIAAAAWLVVFYLVRSEQIDLWFSWASSTPRTTCVEIFGPAKASLRCPYSYLAEGGASDWFNRYGVPKDFWFWALGALAILFAPRMIRWVREGFPSKPD